MTLTFGLGFVLTMVSIVKKSVSGGSVLIEPMLAEWLVLLHYLYNLNELWTVKKVEGTFTSPCIIDCVSWTNAFHLGTWSDIRTQLSTRWSTYRDLKIDHSIIHQNDSSIMYSFWFWFNIFIIWHDRYFRVIILLKTVTECTLTLRWSFCDDVYFFSRYKIHLEPWSRWWEKWVCLICTNLQVILIMCVMSRTSTTWVWGLQRKSRLQEIASENTDIIKMQSSSI